MVTGAIPDAEGAMIEWTGRSEDGSRAWAGARNYRRHDVRVLDFFSYGESPSAGFGDLDLGFGAVDESGTSWVGVEVVQPDGQEAFLDCRRSYGGPDGPVISEAAASLLQAERFLPTRVLLGTFGQLTETSSTSPPASFDPAPRSSGGVIYEWDIAIEGRIGW